MSHMIKLFTENDLLRYVYGETSSNETIQIEEAIVCNPDLEEKYSNIAMDTKLLDSLFLNPSETVLDSIFDYSINLSMSPKKPV